MALTQIPSPASVLIDGADRITVPWYQFLMQLYRMLQSGGSGGAGSSAGYILDVANPALPNARVATDSPTVTVDLTVPGLIRWHTTAAAISQLGYWALITNGSSTSPEPLYDAEGDAVMGFVPTP